MELVSVAMTPVVVATAAVAAAAAAAAAANELTLDFDGAQRGRVFDGIGALSAGATSRFLPDYPEPQRSQILDLLFARSGGAALHWLKIELGGDTQSTCGTEPSPIRADGVINIDRGYETWLMQEAVKRNPEIRLYALPWGFPAWVGHGACERAAHIPPLVNGGCSNDVVAADSISSQRMAKYHAAFVNATAHMSPALNISWIGLWNEDSWTPANAEALRDALDSSSTTQHTRISAPDQGIGGAGMVLQALANTSDRGLRASIDAISVHYPKSISTEAMRAAALPTWSSEDWSLDGSEAGAGCLARALNWNYVEGLYTSTVVWSLLTAIPKFLHFYGTGLLTAGEPWSGHFNQSAPIFIIAHYTQFVSPGWTYLAHGNGTGWLLGGGSFTTLVSPSGEDFTVILETMTRNHSLCKGGPPLELPDGRRWPDQTQRLSLRLSSLPIPRNRSLFRWESMLFVGNKTIDPTEHYPTLFKQKPGILVAADGTLTIDMPIDTLVTLTTVSGGRKDSDASPPSAPFPAHYSDSFGAADDYKRDQMPRFWSDQAGSFAIALSTGQWGRKSGSSIASINAAPDLVLQQQVDSSPSLGGTGWHNRDSEAPISIFGDYTGADTILSVRARIVGRGAPPPPPTTSVVVSPIVSVSSGFCLAVGPGKSVVDGAHIVVWKCLNKMSEQWAINTTETNTLIVVQSSQMCLSTLCPALHLNGSVCQRKCDSSAPSQRWHVSSDEKFSISQNGVCLTSFSLNKGVQTGPCGNNMALWTRAHGRILPPTFVAVALRVGGNLTCTGTFPRNTPGCAAAAKMTDWMQHGIYFVVSADGTWSILSGTTTLSTATGPALGDGWHTIELRTKGTVATAFLDGHEVGTVRDRVFQRGWAALSSGFHLAEFANFSLVREASE